MKLEKIHTDPTLQLRTYKTCFLILGLYHKDIHTSKHIDTATMVHPLFILEYPEVTYHFHSKEWSSFETYSDIRIAY